MATLSASNNQDALTTATYQYNNALQQINNSHDMTNDSSLDNDDTYEYLILEEEEDITSESTGSENDQHITPQNLNDIFYLIRHNKIKLLSKGLTSTFPLKVNTTNNTRLTPAMSAAIFRRHNILKMLLARSEIRVNAQDEHHMTALLYAATNGDQRCLKYLLLAGADPSHTNTEKRNILHLLLLRRHFNTVLYLLEFDKDETIRLKIRSLINQPDKYGMTAVLYACELGHRDLTKYLTQIGADCRHVDNVGRNALCHAIQSKSVDVVKFFLDEVNFDVNEVYTHFNGFTPLFYAAAADSVDVIELLLNYGATIDQKEFKNNDTPLLYAARLGKINSLFTLIYHGADVHVLNNDGINAMLYLIRNGFKDELYYVYGIMTKKINPPLPPNDLQLIIDIAQHRIQSDELYTYLRKLRDTNGFTSLIHAVLGDNLVSVRFLLLDVGVDISQGDKLNRTALYHAVANRFVNLFELLIGAGADVNTRDQDNNTVLMHAVATNNPSFVERLILKRADMTILNKSNWSVLTFACQIGNYDLFAFLITHLRALIPNASEQSPLLSAEHLSLCLNVACIYGRPTLSSSSNAASQSSNANNAINKMGGGSNNNNNNLPKQHVQIINTIIKRTANEGTSRLLDQCHYANPNIIFPGLEPSILAAVRNSDDSPIILNELLSSPNTVNVTIRDKDGYTPVLLAVSKQYHNITRVILNFEQQRGNNSGSGSSGGSGSLSLNTTVNNNTTISSIFYDPNIDQKITPIQQQQWLAYYAPSNIGLKPIVFNHNTTTSSQSGSGNMLSASLRCPNGLTPADHACIIRHDKTFVEVKKRSDHNLKPKDNGYNVSTGELVALGKKFALYLSLIYKVKLPFITYISRGRFVETIKEENIISDPSIIANENEIILQDIDNIFLKDIAEQQEKLGYAIGPTLFDLVLGEQSTYTPRYFSSMMLTNNSNTPLSPNQQQQPQQQQQKLNNNNQQQQQQQYRSIAYQLIPVELHENSKLYKTFLNATCLVEPILDHANSTRPARSQDIPTYRLTCKSLLWVTIVACKNLPFLIALLDCDFVNPPSLSYNTNNNTSSSPVSSNQQQQQPQQQNQNPMMRRPGMQPPQQQQPGRPMMGGRPMGMMMPGRPSGPLVPVGAGGIPGGLGNNMRQPPNMNNNNNNMGQLVSTTSNTINLPNSGSNNNNSVISQFFLRMDNINNENSTLLEILFVYAGYEGCSVQGTQFLLAAITAAKYSPYWDPEYIFICPKNSHRFESKRGKTIQELSELYKLPAAYDIAQKSIQDIEFDVKKSRIGGSTANKK